MTPTERAVDGRGLVPAVAALDDSTLARRLMRDRSFRHPPPPPATADHLARADDALAGTFRHVGESYALGRVFDWRTNPSRDKEWLIAQHKLYMLLDLAQAFRLTGEPRYVARWVELLDHWMATMPSGFITASDAQVEAKRIESVVWSFLMLREAAADPATIPGTLLRRMLEFLARETGYVAANLRPSRNHRTFQLSSIGLVGLLFPELEDSESWTALAAEGLRANLLADFEESGVHVERSTHYHNLALEAGLGFVELATMNGVAVAPDLKDRLHRALLFSMFAQFPDGEIPLINDSDTLDHAAMFLAGNRIYGDARFAFVASLGRQGEAPGETAADFGGYVILRDGWGQDEESFRARQHVFIDCAPLGEGSHSHYDLFSFTWFAGGRQVVVDPGRYTYDAEPLDRIDWRREFKSTRFHNTVCVDGLDQTRYLSKAKSPPPGVERYDRRIHAAKHGPEIVLLARSHALDGPSPWCAGIARSHEYAVLHARAFVHVERAALLVLDILLPQDGAEHVLTSRLHFAREWLGQVGMQHAGDGWVAAAPGWSAAVATSHPGHARLEDGFVSKTYGEKHAAPVLACSLKAHAPVAFATLLSCAEDPRPPGLVSLDQHGMTVTVGDRPFTFRLGQAGRPPEVVSG